MTDRDDSGRTADPARICWIETVDPQHPAVQPVYDELRRRSGRDDTLYLAASLRPVPMLAADAHYRATLHAADTALPAWFLELLATQTAILADCAYAAANHGANIGTLLGNADRGRTMIAQIRAGDYDTGFDARQSALLRHGARLARRPEAIVEGDITALRAAGVRDVEILEATQVIAGFAYWVRYINGLGIMPGDGPVGLKPEPA